MAHSRRQVMTGDAYVKTGAAAFCVAMRGAAARGVSSGAGWLFKGIMILQGILAVGSSWDPVVVSSSTAAPSAIR